MTTSRCSNIGRSAGDFNTDPGEGVFVRERKRLRRLRQPGLAHLLIPFLITDESTPASGVLVATAKQTCMPTLPPWCGTAMTAG